MSVSTATANEGEPLTWQKLSADIALAIHQLNMTAQQNQRHLFIPQAAAVVESIRLMLYAAGLMERDSHHTQDPMLRNPHRAVMASLSKLVLSAKIAAEISASPSMSSDIIFKLQKDAGDVLAAVRNFVTACQQRQVRIEHIAPRLIKDKKAKSEENGDETPAKAKYPLNQDLLVSLQTHANQIYGSVEALSAASAHAIEMQHEDDLVGHSAAQPMKVRTHVVSLFRTISGQISQYLVLLEGICLADADKSLASAIAEFKAEKQYLYDAFGRLFGAIQTLSDVNVAISSSVTRIDEALLNVEDALGRIFACIQLLVGQRRILLARRGTSDTKESLTGSDTSMPAHPTSPRRADDAGSGSSVMGAPAGEDEYDSDTLETGARSIAKEDNALSVPTRRAQRQPSSASNNSSAWQFMNTDPSTPPLPLPSPTVRSRQPSTKSDERSTISNNEWFLGHDHPPGEIVLSSEGALKGGTLSALVERLTLHDTLDTSFIANFLLTYRSFCTTEEFVNLLEQRYTLVAPKNLTPEELEAWSDKKQKLIRLR